MLAFLCGEDGYRLREKLLSLREQFFHEYPHAEERILDVEEREEREIVLKIAEMLQGGSLFSSAQVVVLSGMFSLPKDARENIVDFFEKSYRKNKETLVIVKEEKPDKRSRLFKQLKKQADHYEEFLFLSGVPLFSWVKEYCKKTFSEIVFEKEGIEQLLLFTRGDLFRVTNELEKLTLSLEKSEKLTSEHVKKHVTATAYSVIFSLLDVIGKKDKKQAFRLVEEQYAQGNDAFAILGMFAHHARSVASVLSLFEEKGVRDAREIARLGKVHPFVVEKILKNRMSFDLSRARKMIHLLSRLDISAKIGKIDPKLAVEEVLLRS